MFPFFSKDDSVLVQPLFRNGHSLTFACEILLEAEQGLKIRDREGHQAEVQVHQRRRVDEHSWIYFAELIDGALDPASPTPGYQWRETSRTPLGVRVRSPQLPDFSALTEDLSLEGAQLQTTGPVQVGDEIDFYIDLDNGFPTVAGTARVCWSRLTQPWRAGLAFQEFDPESQSNLKNYLSQRQTESGLPGLTDDPNPAEDFEPSVLEKMALLQSSFDEGDTLVLQLLTSDEGMEIRFPGAKVMQSNLATQLVSRIVTQPTPEGLTRTWLLDPENATIVEIDSGSPEILCRGLPGPD